MQRELRILVVDDEPAVTQCLFLVLDQPDLKFASASNGKEALTRIAAESFDFVITDHKMPGLSGLELVQQLREQNFKGKIVVLSAHLSNDNIRAYTELRVDEMLRKPFDLDQLCRVIDDLAG